MVDFNLPGVLPISASWFYRESELHGAAHTARVFVLQEMISHMYEGDLDINALRWATALHDTRRLNDGPDPDHGKRAARLIENGFPEELTGSSREKAAYAVFWHATPDTQISLFSPELTILKDADALDRVRLGDLDTQYLRLPISSTLVTTASDLFNLSEEKILAGIDPFRAVMEAATEIHLLDLSAFSSRH